MQINTHLWTLFLLTAAVCFGAPLILEHPALPNDRTEPLSPKTMLFAGSQNLQTTSQSVQAGEPKKNAAHFLFEVSTRKERTVYRFGFLFKNKEDDLNTLDQRVREASESGIKVVVLVSEFNQPISNADLSTIRKIHSDLLIIDALQCSPFENDSKNSLLALLPAKSHFRTVGTELLKDFTSSDSGISYEPAELIKRIKEEIPNEKHEPLFLFCPQAWIGEDVNGIVRSYRELAELHDLLIGFPIHDSEMVDGTAGATKSAFVVREAAWDRLLGVYKYQVNAALSIDRLPSSEMKSENQFRYGSWVKPESYSIDSILIALREGAFFTESSGIINDIEIRADTFGLTRPAVTGEKVHIPSGQPVHVELNTQIPDQDTTGELNWLDSVEIVVTSTGESQRFTETEIFLGHATSRREFLVPSGGCTIRGCVRRKNKDGTESIAFTNPIIISNDDEPNNIQGGSLFSKSSLGWLFILFSAATGLLVSFLIARYFQNKHINLQVSDEIRASSLKPVRVQNRSARDADWTPPAPRDATASVTNESVPTVQELPTRGFVFAVAFAFTAFAVYGLFVPLRFRAIDFTEAVEKFSNVRYLNLGLQSRQDWVANILLFVPLGFLFTGALILDRKNILLSRTLAFIACTLGLTVLAVGTEFLQLWFPPRTVSQNDILAETLGGLIGSLFSVFFFQSFVNWTRRIISVTTIEAFIDWSLILYVGMLLFAQLMPFDFVLSMNEFYEKGAKGRISLSLFPQTIDDLTGFCMAIGLFLPVGGWTYRLRKNDLDEHFWQSFLIGIFIAVLFEALQVPVYSRRSALQTVLGGMLGILVGQFITKNYSSFLIKLVVSQSESNQKRVVASIGMCVLYILVIGYFYTGHFVRGTDGETMNRLQEFWQVPFARLYWGSELNAFFVISRQLLLLFPVGFLLSDAVIFGRVSERLKTRFILVLLGIAVLASSLEIAQAWSLDNFADVTDSILLALGGLAGIFARTVIFDFVRFGLDFHQSRIVTLKTILVWLCLGGVAMTGTGYSTLQIVRLASEHMLASEKRIKLAVRDFAETSNLKVESIIVPTPEYPEAIWGATGSDREGDVWIGVSDGRSERASARIVKLVPSQGRLYEVSDVLTELKKHSLLEADSSQSKIHSKFIEGSDGRIYFTSMDEQGEKSDGSQLPTWGSHLWSIDPRSFITEHHAAVPEGLIALSGGGKWIYSLGLFDHVLYQWNVETQELRRRVVGSIGGHVSRNFVTDNRGHTFVPRLKYFGSVEKKPDNPVANSEYVQIELVEFDTLLNEIHSTPLGNYLTDSYWSNHGVTGLAYLSGGAIVFTTSTGRLYRILSPAGEAKATVQDLGWFHPDGECYAPSLFEMKQGQLSGVVSKKNQFEWVTYTLSNFESVSTELPLPPSIDGERGLLLYGSQSKDQFGAAYIVGRKYKTPVVLRITQK